MSTVNPAHGLDLYVDSTRSSSKSSIDFRHVEHRDYTIIVPAAISKRTRSEAGEENNVEVGHVDWRFVSKAISRVRHDKTSGCIWSYYLEEGGIKDLDGGWGRVRGIETHERVVRTPLSVVRTHDIVIEGVNVLSLLMISSREPRQRTYHNTGRRGEVRGVSGPRN